VALPCLRPAETANGAAANWTCSCRSKPNAESRWLRSRRRGLAKQTAGSTAAPSVVGCDLVGNLWPHRDKLGGGPVLGCVWLRPAARDTRPQAVTRYRRLHAGGAITEQLQNGGESLSGRVVWLCSCSIPAETANGAAANWTCSCRSKPNAESRWLRSRRRGLAKQTAGSTAAPSVVGCDLVGNLWPHRDKLGGGPVRGCVWLRPAALGHASPGGHTLPPASCRRGDN
jgi:hypothetical protein